MKDVILIELGKVEFKVLDFKYHGPKCILILRLLWKSSLAGLKLFQKIRELKNCKNSPRNMPTELTEKRHF